MDDFKLLTAIPMLSRVIVLALVIAVVFMWGVL